MKAAMRMRLRAVSLVAPATLPLLLLAVLSALSLVDAGRLVGYSDVNCQSGKTQAAFTPGLCYPSGAGSVTTECYSSNTTRLWFLLRLDSADSACAQFQQSISGWADGECVPVRVGNIGSVQVYCSGAEAARSTAGLLAVFAACWTMLLLASWWR